MSTRGFGICLYMMSLLWRDSEEFLPINQYIFLYLRSSSSHFFLTWAFYRSLASKYDIMKIIKKSVGNVRELCHEVDHLESCLLSLANSNLRPAYHSGPRVKDSLSTHRLPFYSVPF